MKNQGEVNIQSIINTFNQGFRILSHVQHLGSASGLKVSVASILGVAGIILVLRDAKARSFRALPWSSDKISFSEEFLVVPGLRNLGNNCFLNVILQVLLYLNDWVPFILLFCGCFDELLPKFVVILFGSIFFRLWQAVLVFEVSFERGWRNLNIWNLRNWWRVCRLLFPWILYWKVV